MGILKDTLNKVYMYFDERAVDDDWSKLQYVEDQDLDICIRAVERCGLALQYVREQTHYICMAAINENPLALQFVREQSVSLCFEAARKNTKALEYVKDPDIKKEVQDMLGIKISETTDVDYISSVVAKDPNSVGYIDDEGKRKETDEMLKKCSLFS